MTATTFSLDTSCMVAAVCAWHERHADAAAEIERRFDRGERLAVAAHAIVEAYAVLTRLPPPHRLAAADAWSLVKSSFVDQASVVALDGQAHVALVDWLAASDVRGGQSYDALIGACAAEAKAATLLTFNPRHFLPAPPGLTIVEPSA